MFLHQEMHKSLVLFASFSLISLIKTLGFKINTQHSNAYLLHIRSIIYIFQYLPYLRFCTTYSENAKNSLGAYNIWGDIHVKSYSTT